MIYQQPQEILSNYSNPGNFPGYMVSTPDNFPCLLPPRTGFQKYQQLRDYQLLLNYQQLQGYQLLLDYQQRPTPANLKVHLIGSGAHPGGLGCTPDSFRIPAGAARKGVIKKCFHTHILTHSHTHTHKHTHAHTYTSIHHHTKLCRFEE